MWWESCPPLQYGKPIESNPTVCKLYATKTTFTVEEFALLLVGVDPTSFDGTEFSNKAKKEKISGVLSLIQDEIEYPVDKNGFPERPRLYGEKMKNDSFSAAAFFEFCQKKKITPPFDWRPKEQQTENVTELIASVYAVPAPSPEGAEVVDGVTVAALRKVFDHSPALRDIVTAVAEVQAMPRDGLQKPSAETIEAKIRLKAKRNGWGTADDGSLAGTQWTVLKTIVLGRDNGGRPRKKTP